MTDYKYRFSIIPGWIVTDPRRKARDLEVICLLGRHTREGDDWCRRSQVEMAKELDVARSTIQASLNRLVDMGAVERFVVESPNGRDSAHYYRVIYDRKPDSLADFAWDGADDGAANEENDPSSEPPTAATPADRSARPADSGSAPPADSEPAPIKDSLLRPPLNQIEREARAGGEEEEDPKTVERRFRAWWRGWPTYTTDPELNTRRAWLALSPEERRACETRTEDYLKAAKASGRKFSKSAATYLSERAWERLAERSAIEVAPDGHTAYSRAGTALRLALLSRDAAPVRLTPLEERIIEEKPEKTELIWRDRLEKHGWPDALKLHEAATNRRKVSVPPGLVAVSQGFRQVEVNGTEWQAWRRLFQIRNWPWLPEPPGLTWVQFPALPEGFENVDEAVEMALAAFQRRLSEGRGDDDAA